MFLSHISVYFLLVEASNCRICFKSHKWISFKIHSNVEMHKRPGHNFVFMDSVHLCFEDYNSVPVWIMHLIVFGKSECIGMQVLFIYILNANGWNARLNDVPFQNNYFKCTVSISNANISNNYFVKSQSFEWAVEEQRIKSLEALLACPSWAVLACTSKAY